MQKKSWLERVFHALCFEMIATAICAPAGAFFLDRPLLQVGSFTLIMATVAMIWNMIYNSMFDSLWPVSRVVRGLKVRIFHALGFESGFIVVGTLIAAWMLNVTLVQAFFLEIGFILFFFPYTIIFNWIYDILRQRIITARSQKLQQEIV